MDKYIKLSDKVGMHIYQNLNGEYEYTFYMEYADGQREYVFFYLTKEELTKAAKEINDRECLDWDNNI